jgi:hypothetical protein
MHEGQDLLRGRQLSYPARVYDPRAENEFNKSE